MGFVGIVSAGQFYSPGQEYVYQYYGRILTGLPQIDNTFAGLALRGKVILQATSQNNYKLQMKNVNFGTFNEKLSGPEPENWRNVQVEANSPLASQYKQMLESPVEFSVHMSGLKTIANQLIKSVSQNSEIHTQLRELIEKLEIAPRENAKFNLGAWIRLSDDINFAVELNQEDMETLTTRIMSALKDSGLSVMDKVCGRHPVNYQNVFEEIPYNAVVPSDLGLPIYVMAQMTYLHSLQGEMQIDCSYNRPSVSVNVNTKVSFSYTGNVGTYSPFTQEHLMAGIN